MPWRHVKTIASLATPVVLPVQRLVGRLPGSTDPVTMICAGTLSTADFVAGALLEVEERTVVGRLGSPLELRGTAFRRACSAADLVAVEVPRAWQACLPAGAQLRMPAWVSQELLAAGESPVTLPAPIRKEVRRQTRRNAYELRFTTDVSDVRRFYAALYRPYVTARFGSGAVLVDEAQFLAVSRGMTLAMLTAAGDWVAGMLLQQRGATLHLGWFGSTTVPPRAGASEVLDAGSIAWGAAQGVSRVVMGHSRPSLADGVVRYKCRFGAIVRPTRFPQRTVGLWVQRWSPALVASLNAAGFVSFRDGQACVYEAQPGAAAP
ncbi:MAG: hypothetical protein V9E93_16840 [Steroidobacteraceae bacterium]|nr:hypothetical protein [Steroidobacteraceae bacterium]MBP7013310.1 hypothetical protein [Steroidobacteraceae bacterium]